MPDHRLHRGPHPEDHELFADSQLPTLFSAREDYIWLLNHKYSRTAALKLVGDRYQLRTRSRVALSRMCCADAERHQREAKRVVSLKGCDVAIDGYNILTTLEVALSSGPLLRCHDGTIRDLAGLAGTYRMVKETDFALSIITDRLVHLAPASCRILLDKPVSNSGKLRARWQRLLSEGGLNWQCETSGSVDELLSTTEAVVVTSDSRIIDCCKGWFNLAADVLHGFPQPVWIIG